MVFILIVLAVLALNFIAGNHVKTTLDEGESRQAWGGRLILRREENAGAAFGECADNPSGVKKLSGILLLIVGIKFIAALFKKGEGVRKFGYALLFGGALSNFIERMRKGSVTDYVSLNVNIKRIRRIVFNVADVCIALGLIILIVRKLFKNR